MFRQPQCWAQLAEGWNPNYPLWATLCHLWPWGWEHHKMPSSQSIKHQTPLPIAPLTRTLPKKKRSLHPPGKSVLRLYLTPCFFSQGYFILFIYLFNITKTIMRKTAVAQAHKNWALALYLIQHHPSLARQWQLAPEYYQIFFSFSLTFLITFFPQIVNEEVICLQATFSFSLLGASDISMIEEQEICGMSLCLGQGSATQSIITRNICMKTGHPAVAFIGSYLTTQRNSHSVSNNTLCCNLWLSPLENKMGVFFWRLFLAWNWFHSSEYLQRQR